MAKRLFKLAHFALELYKRRTHKCHAKRPAIFVTSNSLWDTVITRLDRRACVFIVAACIFAYPSRVSVQKRVNRCQYVDANTVAIVDGSPTFMLRRVPS